MPLRPLAMRLFGPGFLAGVWLVALGSAPAHATPPCDPPLPSFEILAPEQGEADVPLNVTILARSSGGAFGYGGTSETPADDSMVLVQTDTGEEFPVSIGGEPNRSGLFIRIRPMEPLALMTEYELRRVGEGYSGEPHTFVTGATEDNDPPPSPTALEARGTIIGRGCEAAGIVASIDPTLDTDTRVLRLRQTNELPINTHAPPLLGAGRADRANVLVSEYDAHVEFEAIAIDLAGNESPPAGGHSARTPTEPVCTTSGGPAPPMPLVCWLLPLALLHLLRRRPPSH